MTFRPDLWFLVVPPLMVWVAWWLWPVRGGFGWELPEGEGRLEPAGLSVFPGPRSAVASGSASPPSESSWPELPAGWTAEDVEMTLMDIEYAEAYRP